MNANKGMRKQHLSRRWPQVARISDTLSARAEFAIGRDVEIQRLLLRRFSGRSHLKPMQKLAIPMCTYATVGRFSIVLKSLCCLQANLHKTYDQFIVSDKRTLPRVYKSNGKASLVPRRWSGCYQYVSTSERYL